MEYVIAAVSQKPPRSFTTKRGSQMLTYNIKVQGQGENVIEYAKFADSQAPQTGDVVQGEITRDEYGFKLREDYSKKKQYGGGGYGGFKKRNYQPRDDAAIQAQWAIGQAVAIISDTESYDTRAERLEAVEEAAIELFAMIGRVKKSNNESIEDSPEGEDKVRTVMTGDDPLPSDDWDKKPVDLNEIPF